MLFLYSASTMKFKEDILFKYNFFEFQCILEKNSIHVRGGQSCYLIVQSWNVFSFSVILKVFYNCFHSDKSGRWVHSKVIFLYASLNFTFQNKLGPSTAPLMLHACNDSELIKRNKGRLFCTEVISLIRGSFNLKKGL